MKSESKKLILIVAIGLVTLIITTLIVHNIFTESWVYSLCVGGFAALYLMYKTIVTSSDEFVSFGDDEQDNRRDDSDEKDIYSKYLEQAGAATLELTNFPNRTKEKLLARISYFPFTRAQDSLFDYLYPIVEGTNWTWYEWEYWAPICNERKIATQGMHNTCRPWVDVLDIESERQKYTIELFVKRHTIKEIADELSPSYPEISSISKKKDLIDFFTANSEPYIQLIDEEITTKWNKKKHNTGHDKRKEFKLLCETIIARSEDLREYREAKECGISKFKIEFEDFEKEDEVLYKLGKKKEAPWKEKYLPNVPGLSFYRDDID